MSTMIVIEQLEFQGHCGVTPKERAHPQPLAVDAELDYSTQAFTDAASTADLSRGLDYAAVVDRIRAIGTATDYVLLETLADRVAAALFEEFPIEHLSLWVRKLAPPLPDIKGSVGIRLSRHRRETDGSPAPSPFLSEMTPRLPQGIALDLASGRGRHSLYLAQMGFAVDAIDRDVAALEDLRSAATVRGFPRLTTQLIDLEPTGSPPPELGKERYDVILVFFYLYRPLFPVLLNALKPGGMLVYETFLVENHLRYGHPRRREFCLDANELLRNVEPLRILHYDEGDRVEAGSSARTAGVSVTARLLAQKR